MSLEQGPGAPKCTESRWVTLQGPHSTGHTLAGQLRAPRPPVGAFEVSMWGPQGLTPRFLLVPQGGSEDPPSLLAGPSPGPSCHPDPTRIPGDQMSPGAGRSQGGHRCRGCGLTSSTCGSRRWLPVRSECAQRMLFCGDGRIWLLSRVPATGSPPRQ